MGKTNTGHGTVTDRRVDYVEYKTQGWVTY